MSIARQEPEADNAFGAIAKVFSALARFFGDPAVQEAGKRLFDELELDELPSSGTVGYELPRTGTVSPMLVRPRCEDPDCNGWPHYKDDPQCVNFDPGPERGLE